MYYAHNAEERSAARMVPTDLVMYYAHNAECIMPIMLKNESFSGEEKEEEQQ